MALCGSTIYVGMWIVHGPNGWEHAYCPEAAGASDASIPAPPGIFVCWNCKRSKPLSEHAIGEQYKRCVECHESIGRERHPQVEAAGVRAAEAEPDDDLAGRGEGAESEVAVEPRVPFRCSICKVWHPQRNRALAPSDACTKCAPRDES